jgi:hypothetical protein
VRPFGITNLSFFIEVTSFSFSDFFKLNRRHIAGPLDLSADHAIYVAFNHLQKTCWRVSKMLISQVPDFFLIPGMVALNSFEVDPNDIRTNFLSLRTDLGHHLSSKPAFESHNLCFTIHFLFPL